MPENGQCSFGTNRYTVKAIDTAAGIYGSMSHVNAGRTANLLALPAPDTAAAVYDGTEQAETADRSQQGAYRTQGVAIPAAIPPGKDV